MSASSTTAFASSSSGATGISSSNSSITLDESSQRAQTEARAAVLASLASAGAQHDHALQARAGDLHSNAAAIRAQEDTLRKNTTALARESTLWAKEVETAANAVKELGDVQNWAEMLERDMLVLEETMRQVDGLPKVESASGGSMWR